MTKKSDAPAIRFKGFSDAWEQRKLSDLIIEYKETVDSDCTLPVLTSSKTEGVVLQEEHFGRVQNHDITGYNILPRNYCTYRNRSDGVDFTFNINRCCDKGIISKFYPVFYGNNSDIFFISMVLNYCDEVVREIAYTCTGTGQKVLSFLDLQKMNIRVPSYDEQKKISQYFEQLDNLITLHQRKFEKLTNVKKSMLEKMFPQNGSSYPEIRFKGFTDPWEQRKLGDVVKEITRNDPESEAPIMMITANNGFIEQSERYAFNNAGESLKKYILLKKGELAYNHGASKLRPYGSCFALTTAENARIPFVYHCFSAENQNAEFMSIELNGAEIENQLRKIVSSGARMDGLLNISFDEYTSVSVLLPGTEEQDRIADFFRHLDNLITLHQRELEKLQNIKKSMLEKMFV